MKISTGKAATAAGSFVYLSMFGIETEARLGGTTVGVNDDRPTYNREPTQMLASIVDRVQENRRLDDDEEAAFDTEAVYDMISEQTNFTLFDDGWPKRMFMEGSSLQIQAAALSNCTSGCFDSVVLQMKNEYLTHMDGTGRRRLDDEEDLTNYNIMVNITENDSYAENWTEFTEGKLDCYQTISKYVVAGCTANSALLGCSDIRLTYAAKMGSASDWPARVYGKQATIKSEIASTCNETCFEEVLDVLSDEWYYLSLLSSWAEGTYLYFNEVSDTTIQYLDNGYKILSLPSQVITVPPPPDNTGWLAGFFNTLSIVSSFAGPWADAMEFADSTVKWTVKATKDTIQMSQKSAEYG